MVISADFEKQKQYFFQKKNIAFVKKNYYFIAILLAKIARLTRALRGYLWRHTMFR
jgi:hypothetical protein